MPTLTKRYVIAIILIVFLTVGFVFWLVNRPKPAAIENLGKITFGWNQWSGTLPYLVAYDKGFFSEQGLSVTMKEEASYSILLEDLVAQKIDFAPDLALIDVIQQVSKGKKLTVVGVTDYSDGADGIVAGPGINSPADLKGKKVAVEENTLGDYLLFAALQKYGLKYSDVTKLNYTAQESVKALADGKADAAVTYEPELGQAKKDGWKEIFDSASNPGLIWDTLVFNKEYVAANPKQVKAVLSAYFKAVDFIVGNPEEAHAIGAKYFKISSSDCAEQMKGIKLIGRQENLVRFLYSAGVDSIYNKVKDRNLFLMENQLIDEPIAGEDIIDGQFIKELN